MTDQIKTPPPAVDGGAAADALTGTTIGRFKVLRPLGAGGMGQVYSAEDTTLRRNVAIKRMAPGIRPEADRTRLLKEAQRASALNHPNVGGVYDVFEHAGELWLVMEYVEGITLRQRLKQPLSNEEFFSVAIQCCEGLQAAHEKNIIHGDIKPDNIMLAPGNRVKILDFGVARRAWTSSPGDATKTMETMVATGGTPAYMAPEVLLQRHDDGRSDIFSLGLVFYEMLGGQQPFQSDSLATTVARIVHEEPPTLKNVPGPLAGVISHAIAKKPEERYATVSALLDDLRRVQQGLKPKAGTATGYHQYRMLAALAVILVVLAALLAVRPLRQLLRSSGNPRQTQPSAQTLPQAKILAILPFTATSADSKLNALGEGLVDSVAARLGSLTEDRPLEIIPPRNLRDRKISTLADAKRYFGANLGLALTLEPSGELIKVSYALTNQTGTTLAADSLTVPASDAFSLEQNIAEGTIKALHLQLRSDEAAALTIHGTDRPEAYKDYLQAKGYLLDNTKPENLESAVLMAGEALKLDPNFGMAKAVLGESYWLKYVNNKQKQWVDPAQNNCNDAVKLGNAGAAGHICLGRIDDGSGHFPEAVSEFQLALGLEPSNEEAATHLALALEHEGKITESEKAYQQAVQSHPNSRVAYNEFGTFYLRRNEYDKALQMYARVIEIAPEWYGTYANVGAIYSNMGQYDKAIEPLKKSIQIRPTYAGYLNLGTAYSGLDKPADAAAAYEQATKLDSQQFLGWGNLGDALYNSGARDKSAAPLRKAVGLAESQLKVSPHDPDVLSSLASFYSMLGDRKQALAYLEQALQYGHSDKDILLDAASVYNHLGENGLALEWLAKAVQAGYTPEKIKSLHEFDNLASTPGYQQLMKSHS
jgi:eukaryotic-like serine/threonine-protein kinase